jgi:diadenosine tetraphosphate (Ap4A) HIT family hydrolase
LERSESGGMLIDPKLLVLETARWLFSVRKQQVTLGSGVLLSKSRAAGFEVLTEEDFVDLRRAMGCVAGMYERSFRPAKINYLALMMVDPIVHLHVIPRYAEPRSLLGRVYEDLAWPMPPNMMEALSTRGQDLVEIAGQMRIAHERHLQERADV